MGGDVFPELSVRIVGMFGLGIAICIVAFWVWMIVECATKEPSNGNDKVVWLLVIVFAQFVGALVYYFVRRPTRMRLYGR